MNGNATTSDLPEIGTGEVVIDGQPRKRYLYSVESVAALLGDITERYVRKFIESGQLRSVKLGRRRLVPHDALKEFLANYNVPVEDDPANETAPARAA
ncbi:helix-turn-helix domain-containing protein [Rhizomonospora bruguierae]|uniref:helix-turn-helix domain-containing protein n=1 Tax=Rhizomonospora bruguierae TaxID=1581705 RepID=UPI001BCE3D42|nr:helix-turn-helix domain-containing protein [Micromonospora sp. NBRC 107566]